ncbi:arylsulfatase [Coraliomargarita sp. SDUM461004]|uniref:Arylsulfatase n=1 Tax=Thalassobacterium sedimentorum TaxID=3041258 RepID=A0ABU1AKQ2_9BACT|nr:arylsulfatase [Coraliomargarita sp. SDUM461004]MDQ8194168.1 arylsulfatase [Coraliomargarita sp. SDUM461004]
MHTHTRSRPNVILFIADDLAWGDLCCHDNPYVHTPNLDRLHAQSARLEHYCSGPLCSPARASLLTGRYHLRTRVIDTYCGRSNIDPNERTIAHALSKSGYQCGAFGKWHLGDCYPSRAIDMGFDTTVMHNAGGIGQPGDHPLNNARWQKDSYFDPILYSNGEPKPYRGYCADIFIDEAIRFIDKNKDQPFFTYIATNTPHTPLIVANEWSEKYLKMDIDPKHAKIYGMIENIDYNIGRLMAHLERHGLTENSILIFTSDHGPCSSADGADNRIRWNAGLRDRKGSLYQGGVKVPNFIRYPAGLIKQQAVTRITSPVDILPTVMDFCNIAESTNCPSIDGVSLRGVLTDDSETPPPPADRKVYMQWHRGDVPIPHRNAAVIGDRFKYYTPNENSSGELYDLKNDPCETHDIANEFPEQAKSMRKDYLKWLFDVAGTRGVGTFDSQAIHIGSSVERSTLLTTNDWRLVTGEDWDRTDLRGYWQVKNLKEQQYNIRVRFKQKPDRGLVFLSINDTILTADKIEPDGWIQFDKQVIHEGYIRIESWIEKHSNDSESYLQRFQCACYIELSS